MTGELFWTTVAALLTLATFSFLYKDNPFYKFAEHLVVGVSAGYFTMILLVTSLWPKLVDSIAAGQYFYIIPGILGLMMFFRFSKTKSWLARYPIAIYIGVGAALEMILQLQARVIEQLNATIQMAESIQNGASAGDIINNLIIIVGVVCGLAYFYFSKEHKGVFGGAATMGIWVLMVGFGASFGYTVMARISLLIDRVQFLGNWINLMTG